MITDTNFKGTNSDLQSTIYSDTTPNSNQATEKKQAYLVNNVKSYEREAFVEFISSKREGGENIDLWTYEELTMLVEEFQKKQTEEKKLKAEIDKIQPAFRQSETFNSNSNKDSNTNDNSNIEVINCRRLCRNLFCDYKNITIFIQNPELVDSGVFSSNYIIYEVITEPLKYIVRRRYSDFEKLREMLLKYYPGITIPPLPSKKLGKRRFEDDYVSKRMNFLILFLQAIVDHPYLKASDIVFNFLNTKDRSVFEKKVSDLNQPKTIQYIDDMQTLTGTIKLDFNCVPEVSQITSGVKNIINDFNVSDPLKLYNKLLQEVNDSLKAFDINIKRASISLDAAQNKMDQLSQLTSKIGVNKESTAIYNEGKVFLLKYKQILQSQNACIKSYFKEHLKFHRLQYESFFKENLKDYEEILAKYNNDNNKLTIKKDKLWTQGDVNKWDLPLDLGIDKKVELMKNKEEAFQYMCSKETSQLRELRKRVGYYKNMIKEEYSGLIEYSTIKMRECFKEFAVKFYPSLTEGITTWTNFSIAIEQLEKKDGI